MTFVFWLSIAIIIYAIIGYPLILLAIWKVKGRRPVPEAGPPMRVDFVIPAHNEGAVIAEKLKNTLALLNTVGHEISILVVSDGSTDDTVAQAQSVEDPRIRVLETPGRMGKLDALNYALEHLSGDVVIFSDANSLLSDVALDKMIPHYTDPDVGGVCGQLRIDTKKGGDIAQADDFYWRYDQMLKHAESDLGGVVTAQGSIYSIRRELLQPLPKGPADDFLNSVRVVDQGFRLAFEPEATTFEQVTERATDEMSRRIRSTEMGWNGLMMMRHLMNPFRYGYYGWQLLSHKGLRRLTPVALIFAFIANMFLVSQGTDWLILGLLQIAFYGLALAVWIVPSLRRIPLSSKVMFFCLANLAMLIGVTRSFAGYRSSIWTPIRENS